MMAPSTSGVGEVLGDHGRLVHPPGDFQRLGDDRLQLVQIERLEKVVEGPLLHRLNGRVRRLRNRDEDHGNPGIDFANRLVDIQARLVGQAQVEDNDVGRFGTHAVKPVRTGADDFDLVQGGGKRLPHLLRDHRRVIIDEQQVRHDDFSRCTRDHGSWTASFSG